MCFWYRCRLKGKKLEGARLLPAGSAAPDNLAPPVRRPTAKHMHEHSTTAASSPAVVAMKRVSGVQLPGLHGIEALLRGATPAAGSNVSENMPQVAHGPCMAVRPVEWETYSVQTQTAVDGETRLSWEEACAFIKSPS